MPLFHATLAGRLPSIYRHGLGGGDHKQLWDGAERGVYLSSDPDVCIWVMIEAFMQFASEDMIPKDYYEAIRVIVIDDSRYDAQKLARDPLMEKIEEVFLYRGVIDINGMPVLTPDQIRAGGEPIENERDPESDAIFGRMMQSIRETHDEHRAEGTLRNLMD